MEAEMTYFTIHSRKLSRDFIFSADFRTDKPHDSKYVRLEEPGKPGTLSPQICYGGGFTGNTVSSTPATFERDCRTWYIQYMKSDED
jgi:hypothetical protein